jgi:hypothetical protein
LAITKEIDEENEIQGDIGTSIGLHQMPKAGAHIKVLVFEVIYF